MLVNNVRKWMMILLVSIAVTASLAGCGKKTEEVPEQEAVEEPAEKNDEESAELPQEDFSSVSDETTDSAEEEAETEEEPEVQSDIGKQLETYYEEVLLKKEGLLELPRGYEIGITERHMDGYSIGESYLQEYGICYHAVWDYDKDEQDELLVLALDEDSEKNCSRIYARMYEVIDGQVTETAELGSFMSWVEYDLSQSTEILLRETKDWFYLAEEASGASGIYADGMTYAMRVAHYDGTDFVVDLAKQVSGSDFSDLEDEVADTARLLRNVTFDRTAEDLTYEYRFNRKDDLLSVFYMTAEIGGNLDKYYETGRITDVPPYMVRLFAQGEE